MMARMQIRETAWDQLLADWQACVDTEVCSLPIDVQELLGNGQVHEIKDAQNPTGFVLVNTIGSETQIDSLYDYFAAGDRQSVWKWSFDGKVDFATEYTGQQDDILATQPAGSSFQNPDWVHFWFGQGGGGYDQRFAREYSREFGEEFG